MRIWKYVKKVTKKVFGKRILKGTEVTDNQIHALKVEKSESREGILPPWTEDRIE